jgi:tetratricopeptide (TPR) repeat protein
MTSAKLRVAEILVDTGYRNNDDAKVQRGRAMVEEVLVKNEPDASTLMVMAKIDLAEQNIDKAIEGLRAALEIQPDNPQAHFVLGTALSVNGEGPAARTELARALELDPGLLEARRSLARVHALLSEHEYAIEEGRRYLKERPNAIRTRILVAQSLVILGRKDEALDELNTIPEEQRNVEALYALGRVHLNSGNPVVARGFLTGAIEQMPTHHDILRNLLRLDQSEGRFQESVKRIQDAVAKDPNDAKLRTLMGMVAQMDNRSDDAESEFRKAIELAPGDATAYEHLARLFARTNRLKEAVATYEDAIKVRPDDPNLHQFLALLYQFGGAEDKAVEHYEEAIKYGPHLANSKNNLAYIYAVSGEQLDRALDLAQDAKAEMPDSANVADTLGWVLYKRGIPSAAISYLKEAESHSHGDAAISGPIRYHLAQAYEADGKTEEAKQALERAIGGLEDLAVLQRSGGGEGKTEPTWAVEARAMLTRLQSSG